MRPANRCSEPDPRQLTEPPQARHRGGGVPRDPARPSIRELALDTNWTTAARVIEDLKRSGYRLLRPLPEAPPLSSFSGCPPPRGAPRATARGCQAGSHNPVKEGES